jgi:hypothetical protein
MHAYKLYLDHMHPYKSNQSACIMFLVRMHIYIHGIVECQMLALYCGYIKAVYAFMSLGQVFIVQKTQDGTRAL